MAEQGIKKRDTQPGGRFELMSRPQKARRWKNKLYTYRKYKQPTLEKSLANSDLAGLLAFWLY